MVKIYPPVDLFFYPDFNFNCRFRYFAEIGIQRINEKVFHPPVDMQFYSPVHDGAGRYR